MTDQIMLLTDHERFGLLKEQDAAAWEWVWERVVLPEARSLRTASMARRCGITPEELLGLLYEDMVGKGRLALYRDNGGSLAGWLKTYVRGFVFAAIRENVREIPSEVSDEGEEIPVPVEDPALPRQESWALVQECFGDLWRKDPMKAYVHLLRLRMNLSSTDIMRMLGISSEANVDQLFARAVKEMRKAKAEHEGK